EPEQAVAQPLDVNADGQGSRREAARGDADATQHNTYKLTPAARMERSGMRGPGFRYAPSGLRLINTHSRSWRARAASSPGCRGRTAPTNFRCNRGRARRGAGSSS